MGFFSTILEKLGLKKEEEQAKPVVAAQPVAPVTKPAAAEAVKPKPVAVQREKDDVVAAKPVAAAAAVAAKPATPAPVAISDVDVVKKLETLGAGSNLDWKVSIVDLLKLLDIDSSREARTELAKELGCPADLMSDTAKMNPWLHKEVLRQIAKNGGNIPANLLD